MKVRIRNYAERLVSKKELKNGTIFEFSTYTELFALYNRVNNSEGTEFDTENEYVWAEIIICPDMFELRIDAEPID